MLVLVMIVIAILMFTTVIATKATNMQTGVAGGGGGWGARRTWVLAAHLSVDIAVHCAHNERGQCCEHHIVQRHVEICIATDAELVNTFPHTLSD